MSFCSGLIIIKSSLEHYQHRATAQIREQMTGPDLHVFTLKFLALKTTGFSPIKNTFQNFFDLGLPLFYATFQCGP